MFFGATDGLSSAATGAAIDSAAAAIATFIASSPSALGASGTCLHGTNEAREGELGQPPLARLAVIDFRDHEGVRDRPTADDRLQVKVFQHDRRLVEHPHVDRVDRCLLVPDATALDRGEFNGLAPRSAHVGELGALV